MMQESNSLRVSHHSILLLSVKLHKRLDAAGVGSGSFHYIDVFSLAALRMEDREGWREGICVGQLRPTQKKNTCAEKSFEEYHFQLSLDDSVCSMFTRWLVLFTLLQKHLKHS